MCLLEIEKATPYFSEAAAFQHSIWPVCTPIAKWEELTSAQVKRLDFLKVIFRKNTFF